MHFLSIEQEVQFAFNLQVIVYVRWNALLFQVLVADRHMDRFFSKWQWRRTWWWRL